MIIVILAQGKLRIILNVQEAQYSCHLPDASGQLKTDEHSLISLLQLAVARSIGSSDSYNTYGTKRIGSTTAP